MSGSMDGGSEDMLLKRIFDTKQLDDIRWVYTLVYKKSTLRTAEVAL